MPNQVIGRVSFYSFPSSSLGMRYQKLLLPETRQARACKARVPKLELGNQREPFDIENAVPMNNQKMHYFPEQDVIHLAITDEDEIESVELRPNVTAELNAEGDLIGIEILKASTFLRDFILESTQAKLMQLKQSVK